jgi:hypothetical protein
MNNLFIGIFITNKDYINAIKNTFLKNTNINYRFFSNLEIDECIEFDNYYEIINWVNKKINPDFFVLCNQDVYININNLLKFIETLSKNELIYAGGHGDYRFINDFKFYFHSPNPGIILSNESLKILSNTKLFNEYNKLCKKYDSGLINIEGVSIGYHATLFNFRIINNSDIHFCNYDGNPCHRGFINRSTLISCSNMSISDINNFYKIETNIINKNIGKKKLIIYPIGGLGNLLFQYFNAINLSIEKNYKLYFIKNLNYWRGDMNKYCIFNNLNYIDENSIIESAYIRLNEQVQYYQPLELKEDTNYILYGYFQSYKYFINNIELIKVKLFENIQKEYNEIKTNHLKKYNKTCLIHVRRGDYLLYPNLHPVCSNEYYSKSIEYVNKYPNIKYLVFSDDFEYVSHWYILKDLNYEIIGETDPVKVLIMMSLCTHFIIANSTLSLASYFLRNNKDAILIGPKNWFGSGIPNYKIEDILPENAILY